MPNIKLTPKQKVIISGMANGEELKVFYALEKGPRYQLDEVWISASSVRGLEDRELIRSTGKGKRGEVYELTDAGKEAAKEL